MRIIRTDDRGEHVRDVQHRLVALGHAISPDELEGRFGSTTLEAVRAFQHSRSLPVDGLVGPDTWGQLVEAGYRLGDRTLYLRYPFLRGDDVGELQRRLNGLGFDAGKGDGILGRETDGAIRDFQRNVGQEIDGIVGPDTIAAMARLRPDDAATSRAVVREAEAVRSLHASLEGAVVAIDAGIGPGEEAVTGPSGLAEAAATRDLAAELAAELRGRSAVPILVSERVDGVELASSSERATAANAAGAGLCVSFQLGGPDEGCSAAYFGTGTTHSPMGERLASLLVERMSAALDLQVSGTRRLAVSILRETRMTAVIVAPCRILDPVEEERLRDPSFRRGVAVSVADAIEEFLGAPTSA
ncbi:MAG: peptidoglycan-binding protein [Actinomycetota bacterium]